MKSKILKNTLSLFFIATITIFLLEFALFLWVRFSYLPIDIPGYSFFNVRRYWTDNNIWFGATHPPNISYRHTKNCLDVLYQTNNFGFRDKNWTRNDTAKTSVIILGDSFMEGYGVEENSRLSNLLETQTNIYHMNFSMSGNVGPTQYYLIYEYLAKNFSHQAILVGIFPNNDFIDDDLEIGKRLYNDRYRPYWIGAYPDYKLTYFLDDPKKSELYFYGENFCKQILKNFSYSYNVFAYFYLLKKQSFPLESKNTVFSKENYHDKKSVVKESSMPNYFHFSQAQYERLIFSIKAIDNAAFDKKVILLTIPTKEEVLQFKSVRQNPLGEKLSKFAHSENIEYIDLLEYFANFSDVELETLYYDCDRHWNSKGHQITAKIVSEKVKFYSSPKTHNKNDSVQ